MTIEQLAAESGMTVRNIRAHRARGLLPAPEVRERVGYYSADHLGRLRLIQGMQAEGFNLRAIQRLLEDTHGRPQDILSLKEAVRAPFESEEPRIFTVPELRERFGAQLDAELLSRGERIGLLVALDEDRYEAPMPSLLDTAAQVVAQGIPLSHALEVVAKVEQQCKSVAREFVKLFLAELWKPFAAAGYPEDRWIEVTQAIERLRPLASDTLLGAFQITMSQEVESAFGREMERMTGKRR